MRWFLLIAGISVLLLAGCADGSESRPLPTSGGDLDEMMVIVDDKDFHTYLDSMLMYAFYAPYPGLPQLYEPLLPIKIREWSRYKNAEDIFHKYRHLAFVGILEEETPISLHVQKAIGKQLYQRAYEDTTFYFAIDRNKYANPQLVIYIFAPTREALVKRIMAHKEELVATIKAHENKRLRKKLYTDGELQKATNHLEKNMGITMRFPDDFELVQANDSFLWLHKEMAVFDNRENITKEIKHDWMIRTYALNDEVNELTLTAPPYEAQEVQGYPFILRDRLLANHIHGYDSTLSPHTDAKRPLFQVKKQYHNISALLSRGLWRLEGPFMGGPFINATFLSKDSTHLIMIDGMIFAAGSDKRDMIREYEAQLSTLRYTTVP